MTITSTPQNTYRLMASNASTVAHIAQDGDPLCGISVVANQLGYVHPDTADLYTVCQRCYAKREEPERPFALTPQSYKGALLEMTNTGYLYHPAGQRRPLFFTKQDLETLHVLTAGDCGPDVPLDCPCVEYGIELGVERMRDGIGHRA